MSRASHTWLSIESMRSAQSVVRSLVRSRVGGYDHCARQCDKLITEITEMRSDDNDGVDLDAPVAVMPLAIVVEVEAAVARAARAQIAWGARDWAVAYEVTDLVASVTTKGGRVEGGD